MTLVDVLASRRLILVTGKGGAGKSVLAATLGRLLAARGRRVLLLESDPRESLYRYLGVDPSGGDTIDVGPRLRLRNLDPRTVIDDLVRDALPIPFLISRVLRSPVYRHFVDGAPGLKEAAALAHAVRELKHARRGPDVVVFDAPATGHALAMLDAPPLLAGAVKTGPIGRMIDEIATFLDDRGAFAAVVAGLAEGLATEETLELTEGLEARRRRPVAVVVNALYPRWSGPAPADSAGRAWQRRRAAQQASLDHLRAGWDGPVIELPLSRFERDDELVSTLEPHLERGLAAREAGR
jgi:anion-transporting  ArsA/GET3 family ATPase